MPDKTQQSPRPWSVQQSIVVLSDQWIRVRAEDCLTEEGVRIAPYYVLEYPDWVIIAAVDESDNLILTEQYRHGLGVVSLELPTGRVDPTDADVLGAAKRELEEETGFLSDSWQHIVTLAPNPATHNNSCHVFLASKVRFASAPKDDPIERMKLLKVPIIEAGRLAKEGHIVQATHVAALALVLTKLKCW